MVVSHLPYASQFVEELVYSPSRPWFICSIFVFRSSGCISCQQLTPTCCQPERKSRTDSIELRVGFVQEPPQHDLSRIQIRYRAVHIARYDVLGVDVDAHWICNNGLFNSHAGG